MYRALASGVLGACSHTIILSMAILTCAVAASAQQAVPLTVNPPGMPRNQEQLELNYALSTWPGHYDNREQLQADELNGRTTIETGGHIRVHTFVRRVELPQLGPGFLYVEEYKDNDPTAILQQRLYELSADAKEQAVRVKMHVFKDTTKWRAALDDAATLKTLTRADFDGLQGCDVLLRRETSALYGATDLKTCFSQVGKIKRALDYQVRLFADEASFRSRLVDLTSGKTVEQMSGFRWHHLQRARMFACMLDFPQEKRTPGHYLGHYAKVHDQGGGYTLKLPDGRQVFFNLRIYSSYAMHRKTLTMTVQENNEQGRTLSYGWADPKADWIGMNLLWLRIQCDIDTPENTRLQYEMGGPTRP